MVFPGPSAGCRCHLSAGPYFFGEKLSLGFHPIGTCISGQRESVPPLSNEVSSETNFFVGWFGSSSGSTRF
jgi:hypothetical protein